jgi:hypothetical protein
MRRVQTRTSQPDRRPPGWALWTGTGLFAAVTAALLLWLSGALPAGSYTPEFSGGARAQISQKSFDYGDVKNESQVETVFEVKNVGDDRLYFDGPPLVQVVEGCCPPQAQVNKTVLEPGESAEVALAFSMHAGMDGPHDFRVKVRTNDSVEPEQEVVVLSNWVP